MFQPILGRVTMCAAGVLVLAVLSGCATTDSGSAKLDIDESAEQAVDGPQTAEEVPVAESLAEEEIPAQEKLVLADAEVEEALTDLTKIGDSPLERLETVETAEIAGSAPEPAVIEDSPPEQVETPEESAASTEEAEPQAALCYMAVDFGSELVLSETVRVDIDDRMVALVGAGDKTVVRYAEGEHTLTFARRNASKKMRVAGSFTVELQPFVYTKILIKDISSKKRKRIIVRVVQDGNEVHKQVIDL